uniref:N-acetyltransferase n=1 Tax=Streptomyces sp. NBC_00003 TaxID=2903608 RepID=A0AAU2VEI9_9ACTN
MTDTENIEISTLAERPELTAQLYDISDKWPVFIARDLVGYALLSRVPEEFPQYCVVATEGDRLIARGYSVPFNATLEGREEMPDRGWDQVLTWAFDDLRRERPVTTASALEITIDLDHLGRGLSHLMLAALRDAVQRQGLGALVAPVRPTAKHLQPRVPMAEYMRQVRDDGLPADPWLRVHVRAGGTIEKAAAASMTVSGTPAEWSGWTGVPFDRDGEIEVPDALVPAHCDTRHDRVSYVEPNAWVRHGLCP